MSEFGSDYHYHPCNFYSTTPMNHTIEDMYNITHGTFKEFDMDGYDPHKTAIPISRESLISKDKNRDIFNSATKRAKDPGPFEYAADKDRVYKMYWDKATGKFHKCRRNTFTEETMKNAKKIPGPSDYMPIPKGEPVKKTAKLGKFK